MKLFRAICAVVVYTLWSVAFCNSQNLTNSVDVSPINAEVSSTARVNSVTSSSLSETSLHSEASSTNSLHISTAQRTPGVDSTSAITPSTNSNTSEANTRISSTETSTSASEVFSLLDSTTSQMSLASSSSSSSDVSAANDVQTSSSISHLYTTASSAQSQLSSVSLSDQTASETRQIVEAEINTNTSNQLTTSQTTTIASFASETGSSDITSSTTLTSTSTTTTTTTMMPTSITAAAANTAPAASTTTLVTLAATNTTSEQAITSIPPSSICATNIPNASTTPHEVTHIESVTSTNSTFGTKSNESNIHFTTEASQHFYSENSTTQHVDISSSENPSSSNDTNNTSRPFEEQHNITSTTEIDGRESSGIHDHVPETNATTMESITGLYSSSPQPAIEISDITDVEDLSDKLEDERHKKYWTKSDIFLVIGVMFLMNTVNLILVVYCVLRITKKRQRWERPPMKYGSRILYNNSPQVECIRAVSGRDLATDVECKQGETPQGESVPVIRIDEGWCAPYHKDDKPKDKTEDTGV